MKKYTYILAAGLIVFSASSCRKSYVCQCTGKSMSKSNFDIYASSDGNAERKCAKNNADGDNGGSVGCRIIR
jgi:hypothetical protein